ncbi:hypothetical protein CRYUN_Cryun03dG0013900 [Craigia yunnanensis]
MIPTLTFPVPLCSLLQGSSSGVSVEKTKSRLVSAMLGLNGCYRLSRRDSLKGMMDLHMICGNYGKIKGWRWKEFTESEVPITFQGNHMKPVLDLVNPQHK